MIIIYLYASWKISSGVFIRISKGFINAILITVITTLTITESTAADPTVFRIPGISPAPNR